MYRAFRSEAYLTMPVSTLEYWPAFQGFQGGPRICIRLPRDGPYTGVLSTFTNVKHIRVGMWVGAAGGKKSN